MKITDISQQKNNPERYNLYIDGKFFCGISSLTIAKENLYKGLDINEERLKEIIDVDLENRIFDRVLENISKSPKTEFQVKKYIKDLLFKKAGSWFSKETEVDEQKILDNVINRLKEYRFLDDENYARIFVESRIKNRPRSKIVLINELRGKGVSKDIAVKVCDELVKDEFDLLKMIYRKKFGDEPFSITETKKIQYLLRKGFSWDLIQDLASNDSGE